MEDIPMRRSATLPCEITYAGVDYHKKFSMVALGDQSGKVVTTQRLPNEQHAIESFFSQYPNLQVAVESCRGYEWFVDLLKELGMTVHMANPYQVALIAKTRCKTDKIDSRILMELLAMGFLPTCYQATPAERCLRERLRWRCHLVRNATRIKVRIHSLLDKENVGSTLGKYIWKGAAREALEKVKLTGTGRQDLLKKHMKILEQFEKLVSIEDEWIRKAARANPDALLLMTVPGIGEFSAMLILAELGDVSRFKRSAQVVNFAGLVPSLHQSANKRFMGPITKQGSPALRWILVQDAWRAVRHSPQFRFFFTSVSRRCGRHAAIIATARKLLEVAYRVLRDQTPYDAARVGKQSA
jgi:transposase